MSQPDTALTTEAIRVERRRWRRAWARGEATTRPAHQGSGAGRDKWAVRVAVIDRERTLHGWSQRDLARHAHVDPGTLSDLLAGRRRPTLGTVQAICTSLGLTLADVLTFARGGEGRGGSVGAG